MTTALIQRSVVSADGTAIQAVTGGSGPALVIVCGPLDHHVSGSCLAVGTALAERFSVTHFDRRGRGGSTSTEPYAVEREIEDLHAVIAEVGGTAHLLGLNAGGGLVLRALAAGVPADRAVVYEAPYRAQGDPDGDDVTHLHTIDSLVAAGRRSAALRYFLVRIAGLPWYAPAMLRFRRAIWRRLLEVAPTLPNDVRVMNGFALPGREFAAIDRPTLIAVGGRSPDWMKRAVQATVEAVPDSEHTVLVDQGTDVDGAALAQVAAAFLERRSPADRLG